MPKRVIDGDALWKSEKLNQVSPPSYRAEYANLIPLALANGSFEADPRLVWATVYAYNRPDITREAVESMLGEFVRVGMLFVWRDSSTSKTWGYWIGIEKPGRLPGKSRHGTNERIGAQPPENGLRKFLDSINFHTETTGFQPLPNGNEKLLGFGSGYCVGSGSGLGNTLAHPLDEPGDGGSQDVPVDGETKPPEPPSKGTPTDRRLPTAKRSVSALEVYNRYPKKVGRDKAVPAICRAIVSLADEGATESHADFAGDEEAAALWLGARVDLYATSAQGQQPDRSKVPYPATWFNAGRYSDDPAEWGYVVGDKKSNTAKVFEQIGGGGEKDSGFSEILSRPAPKWAQAGAQ